MWSGKVSMKKWHVSKHWRKQRVRHADIYERCHLLCVFKGSCYCRRAWMKSGKQPTYYSNAKHWWWWLGCSNATDKNCLDSSYIFKIGFEDRGYRISRYSWVKNNSTFLSWSNGKNGITNVWERNTVEQIRVCVKGKCGLGRGRLGPQFDWFHAGCSEREKF